MVSTEVLVECEVFFEFVVEINCILYHSPPLTQANRSLTTTADHIFSRQLCPCLSVLYAPPPWVYYERRRYGRNERRRFDRNERRRYGRNERRRFDRNEHRRYDSNERRRFDSAAALSIHCRPGHTLKGQNMISETRTIRLLLRIQYC